MRRAGNCARHRLQDGRIGVHMEGLRGREAARSQAPGTVSAFSRNRDAAWVRRALASAVAADAQSGLEEPEGARQ